MQLSYKIIRTKKRRRTVSLHIERSGDIIIRAPVKMDDGFIKKFFNKSKPWIEKKLKQQILRPAAQPKQFRNGEEFLYLGKQYGLEIVGDCIDNCRGVLQYAPTDLNFIDNKFILRENCVSRARELFAAWYKEHAEREITRRVDLYSRLTRLYPRKLRISSARSRWGSCSAKNTVSVNWKLIMAPPEVLDYIIVHELAHIEEKNHSARFWNLVAKFLSAYKKDKQWLKKNGHLLNI